MNDLHYVKVEMDKNGASEVKIKATRGEIVRAVSMLISDCVENNLLPDVKDHEVPVGVKIGTAIAVGIECTTLSLASMENVYSELISVLNTQLININDKTMKGEN